MLRAGAYLLGKERENSIWQLDYELEISEVVVNEGKVRINNHFIEIENK